MRIDFVISDKKKIQEITKIVIEKMKDVNEASTKGANAHYTLLEPSTGEVLFATDSIDVFDTLLELIRVRVEKLNLQVEE